MPGFMSAEVFPGCCSIRCFWFYRTQGIWGLASLPFSILLSLKWCEEFVPYGCCRFIFQLIASLVYADNGTAVKKPLDNGEAPLLIHCDGLEFPSTERTVKLIDGRASVKLKISQVSLIIWTEVLLLWMTWSQIPKYDNPCPPPQIL